MPYEHHPPVVPGHKVATVGDLADLRLELGADQRDAHVRFEVMVQAVLAHCSRPGDRRAREALMPGLHVLFGPFFVIGRTLEAYFRALARAHLPGRAGHHRALGRRTARCEDPAPPGCALPGAVVDILPAMNDQDSHRSPGGNVLRFALYRQGQKSHVATRCPRPWPAAV